MSGILPALRSLLFVLDIQMLQAGATLLFLKPSHVHVVHDHLLCLLRKPRHAAVAGHVRLDPAVPHNGLGSLARFGVGPVDAAHRFEQRLDVGLRLRWANIEKEKGELRLMETIKSHCVW